MQIPLKYGVRTEFWTAPQVFGFHNRKIPAALAKGALFRRVVITGGEALHCRVTGPKRGSTSSGRPAALRWYSQ